MVYDFILQEARGQIEEKTKIDILNDLPEITVAGNYLATSYDGKDYEPTKKAIERIPEVELSPMLRWFNSNL